MKIPIVILDKPNKNNRIYPRDVMEKAIAKYKKDFVDENRALVQKKQPGNSMVSLLDCVGVVKEITIEGDKVVVDVEFLPNVKDGNVIEEGLKSGKLHLRTHGMGTIHKQDDGTYKIGEDYEFISCFATDDPA